MSSQLGPSATASAWSTTGGSSPPAALLREAPGHAALEDLCVAAASLTTCWLAAGLLRRIPGARRVLG